MPAIAAAAATGDGRSAHHELARQVLQLASWMGAMGQGSREELVELFEVGVWCGCVKC